MKPEKFYKKCQLLLTIAVIAFVANLIIGGLIIKSFPLLGAIFMSLALLSIILGIAVTVAGMGDYKPFPPEQPLPMFTGSANYAVIYLEKGYWVIEYLHNGADAKHRAHSLRAKNYLGVIVYRYNTILRTIEHFY